MADEVLVEATDGVLVVTINRPQVRNAVNMAVSEGIAAAADELERRPDLVVGVLTGAGSTFCAGMDLKAFVAGERPSLPGRGLGGITQAPPRKPLLAAVEGWALAGGFELALASDLIVAGRSARFGLPEVKRGLVASAGGLIKLPRALPYPLAMRMALTGDPLTAEEAHAHGLVAELTEDGGALAAALELARRIAANGPLAVAATKRIIGDALGLTDAEGWARMRAVAEPIFESEDAQEGARAFTEKRAPAWKGA